MEATYKSDDIDGAVNRLRSGAHEAVDKVANAATQAADTLSAKGTKVQYAEHQFEEKCRSYIHENPVAVLGIAVGAGFLLSRLLSGR